MIIILLCILILEINRPPVISSLDFTDYFLFTMRTMNEFTEKNVDWFTSHFQYTHKLYHLEFDDKNWGNDMDLFIQSCLISLNILSYYVDKASIYYREKEIWKMLCFICRILGVQLHTNNKAQFYDCDQVYHIYTSFLLAMYLCGIQMGNDVFELKNDMYDFLKYYRIRFYSKYIIKMDKTEIFENYKKYIEACKKFNDNLVDKCKAY
ncbi:hypothetical protein [Drosophila suzukii associated hytrosavirus 1]|nr:hypothetical protein [Drosophila suzukii associated hytrosavirus 1]